MLAKGYRTAQSYACGRFATGRLKLALDVNTARLLVAKASFSVLPSIQILRRRGMSVFLSPITESQRLEALDGYDILDTSPEVGFDDAVLLARQICNTPIALVSLVASKRQWFKAAAGLDLRETPIEQSVCAHALRQADTLIIPDLSLDPRTRTNTLVTGAPFIRFYAGALLKTRSGIAIGTLCVIDTVPRPGGLTEQQTFSLEALARQVMTQLEYRRTMIKAEHAALEERDAAAASTARALESERLAALLRASETRLRMAQAAGRIGSFELDIATDRLTVTDQFCLIFGLPIMPTVNAPDIERLIHPGDEHLISDRGSRESGEMALYTEYRVRKPQTGDVAWISRSAMLVRNANGVTIRVLGTVCDITERKNIEERQRILNDELGHRLKNTLALVQAITRQTLRNASDHEAVEAFERRIDALGRAHDVLLQHSWSAADLRQLAANVLGLHGAASRFHLDGPRLRLTAKAALSTSLVLHELATNAIKHGALSVSTGYVRLSWEIEPDCLIVKWTEHDGPPVVAPTKIGLGSRLIDMGIIGGSRSRKRYEPSGLVVEFRAPLAAIDDGS